MHRKMQFGCLGLPDLKAYHIAATLDQIKYWWHGSVDKWWVAMETDLAGVSNWRAVLLDPINETPHISLQAPSTKVTLQYWNSLARGRPPKSGSSQIPIPLEVISLHIPDFPLKTWIDKGMLTLDTLYDGSRFKSFPELQNKYDLPPSDYLKLAQIQHLLRPLDTTQGSLPSLILPLLRTSSAHKAKSSRIFYDLTTSNDVFNKSQTMIKWEENLGTVLTIRVAKHNQMGSQVICLC